MNGLLSILLGAIVGAILSYLLPYIVKTVIFIFKRKSPTIVCGEWVSYIWWTKNGKIEFAETKVDIKKGILSEYYATYSDANATYFGKAHMECNNLCINASHKNVKVSTVYEGTIDIRYDLSTIENKNQLFGFWLSRNADKKVSCGGAILSRKEKEIDISQSLEIIKNQFNINTDVPVLSLLY
ncbi:MAG: hypothetical protein FWF53_07700 [Candidatus Azobacteroides sp.]|nr:hypothetical protein [Candidatus Azobacteroides sp.]